MGVFVAVVVVVAQALYYDDHQSNYNVMTNQHVVNKGKAFRELSKLFIFKHTFTVSRLFSCSQSFFCDANSGVTQY